LSGGTFSENTAQQGASIAVPDGLARGGAVSGEAQVVISGGEYASNLAHGGHGGAIDGVDVSLTDSKLTQNTAHGRGGAVTAKQLAATRVTATGNTAGGSGGGAFATESDATLTACNIENNTVDTLYVSYYIGALLAPAGGGGLSVLGELVITDTDVTGNSGIARFHEGGHATFAGGGIRAGSVRGERINVSNNRASSINPTPGDGSSRADSSGGGGIAGRTRVALLNSTLSGNSAARLDLPFPIPSLSSARGAAVLATRLELDHTTITDNSDPSIPSLDVAELVTHRSVAVAPAETQVCAPGTIASTSSYNWFSDTSCSLAGGGDHQGNAEFLLEPLAENGGAVSSRAPAAGSVLIDAVPSTACSTAIDARGVTRPQGGGCDIGALEVVR
jgi:hypothetical protein